MSNQKRPEENPALIQALCKLTKILDVKIFKIVEDILIICLEKLFETGILSGFGSYEAVMTKLTYILMLYFT